MNFDLSDEQKMLVSGAERFVRERCTLEARRAAATTAEGFSRQHLSQFAEMGWLALPLPEAAGGLGGDICDLALLMEQLGHGIVAEPIVDSAVLCATLLAHSPNKDVCNEILARVATGECLLALAHIEGNGRSELETDVESRATQTAQGWSLNGSKHRVFYGNSANYFVVSARTAANAYDFFLVDATTAGITLNTYRLIDGTCGADIRFDNVQLPTSALLLQGDAAITALEDAIERAILALSAAALGSMEAVMTMTAEYLKTRVQYGQPLAQFQSLQHRMADMLVETEQARSMLYRALSAFEKTVAFEKTAAFESTNAAQEHGTDFRRSAISGAKVLIAKAGLFVSGQGIQLHGGIGTTEEFAVSHHYKTMLTYEKRFGDSDFHLRRCRARH